MLLKVFCWMFLVGQCTILPTLSARLSEPDIKLLSQLQSDYYVQVKQVLDDTEYHANTLYFVDDDLKVNAAAYFYEMANEELQQLAPLKEECEHIDPCLACFDNEGHISRVATSATESLVTFLENQKYEFNRTIADILSNLHQSALLSTVVYEKFKDSSDFETNAKNYYERMKKALDYEAALYEKTITTTITKVTEFSVRATVEANDQLQDIFNTIVECVDDALHPH